MSRVIFVRTARALVRALFRHERTEDSLSSSKRMKPIASSKAPSPYFSTKRRAMPVAGVGRERYAKACFRQTRHVLGPLDLPRHPEQALGGAAQHYEQLL